MNSEQEYNFYKIKKREYFSHFALEHFKEMRILRSGELLGKENKDWRLVSEHCLMEAVIVDILAEFLGCENKEDVVQAALLHDWYKRTEVKKMNELGPSVGYAAAAEEEDESLVSFEIKPQVITLMHSNIPKNADEKYIQNRSIAEKIFHFADAILKDSDIIGFRERMDSKNQKPRMVVFSESFREKFNGKSLLEFQVEVAESEEKEFEKMLNIEPGHLVRFILDKLNEKILK